MASGTTTVPSDPTAETTPSIMLRRSAETARTTAVIANDVAVHDRATPINPPEMISASAPWAAAMMPRPSDVDRRARHHRDAQTKAVCNRADQRLREAPDNVLDR